MRQPTGPCAFLAAMLLAACSSGTTNSTSTSPSPSATPSATATPPPAFRVLLTATTASGIDILLYDSGTSAQQKLVSIPSGFPPQPRFISAHRVGYIETTNQGTSRIMTLDLGTHTTVPEIATSGYVSAFAYKHDGSTLAYLLHDPTTGKAGLHLRTNGQETIYGLNNVPGRGGSGEDELRLEYSPDDRHLLMVDTFVGNQGNAPETGQFIVFRADNTVAFVPPSGSSTNATHAAWARQGERLYYRDASGVRTWDAEVTSVGTLAGGLHWYDPSPSPDGRWIAYTVLDPQSVPHVKLYDLNNNRPTDVTAAPRSHPVFVTADTVWYLEEVPCGAECFGGAYRTSGKVFAYNLALKSESALPLRGVTDLSDLAIFPR